MFPKAPVKKWLLNRYELKVHEKPINDNARELAITGIVQIQAATNTVDLASNSALLISGLHQQRYVP